MEDDRDLKKEWELQEGQNKQDDSLKPDENGSPGSGLGIGPEEEPNETPQDELIRHEQEDTQDSELDPEQGEATDDNINPERDQEADGSAEGTLETSAVSDKHETVTVIEQAHLWTIEENPDRRFASLPLLLHYLRHEGYALVDIAGLNESGMDIARHIWKKEEGR
jgi:hypothetical protein